MILRINFSEYHQITPSQRLTTPENEVFTKFVTLLQQQENESTRIPASRETT